MSRSVIVTGAGSGIGRATARAFLAQGDRVALIGRRAGALAETAGGSPNALPLPCDVTEPGQVETAFDAVTAAFGRLDILFNNAGTFSRGGPPDEIPVEEWLTVVNVNLTGAFLCARAAFARMRRQSPQGGRIINNGSISAHAPRPGSAPYTATKHAITGLTKSLSLDGRPFDIACGQIDIGNALTEMAAPMLKGVRQADGEMRVEPVMDAGDIARAVLHMANLPLSANVQSMMIMATKMPFVGRG
jgi:NAD(P)-dependent dehydrogenase (short-subunit alcohol dehydrogenase family)